MLHDEATDEKRDFEEQAIIYTERNYLDEVRDL